MKGCQIVKSIDTNNSRKDEKDMSRNNWSEIKKMNREELKNEFTNLAKEVEQLSKYVGAISNEDEEDNFSEDVSYCVETLHRLRTRVSGIYFNVE